MQVLLTTYTPGGTQMITGVLCSSNVQLQLFASCSCCCMHRVRARRTHSQVHRLPLADLAQEKVQANNH
jgi:hypothetical protein